jgi:hypothetical protein
VPAEREGETRVPDGLTDAGPVLAVEHDHLPVSQLIRHIAADWPRERLTLGELIQAVGMRGFGILIVLFAIPNLLPIYIPGLSPIFGVPLLIVCLQLALGYSAPRLPGFLTSRSMKRSDLLAISQKAAPWLERIERVVKPRPSWLTGRNGERLIGLFGVFLASIVIVPLPFTNGPPSLACAIMAIGLMEEDSLTIAGGALFGVFAAALGLSIIGSVSYLFLAAFSWLFGV